DPRTGQHMEQRGPGFRDHADGGAGGNVYGNRAYARAANDRIAPPQADDPWSRPGPRQPGGQFGYEQQQPCVTLTLGETHDEYGLTGLEHPAYAPRSGDPAPTHRARGSVSFSH